jgi:6-phosphogluconolactonase (cycloisomerase 2 family)
MKTPFKLIFAASVIFASCQKENFNEQQQQQLSANDVSEAMVSENGNNPDDAVLNNNKASAQTGYVYIESNDANANSIIMYKQNTDGTLTWGGQTTSGGKGSGAGLGSEGAIVINKEHTWLFAVNAGSNSVSSFKIKNDGSLVLKHTVSSEGTLPISVCVYNDLVFVVNSTTANICGFKLWGDGNLAKIDGSQKSLSDITAAPAQISFNPWGNGLLVTEKTTNKISAFTIDANGVVTGSKANNSAGQTPFGFSIARDKYMIVSNATGGTEKESSCTSYKNLYLNVSDVNGTVANHQSSVCWVTTAKYGRYAYVANTGSNNLNAYFIASNGALYFLPWTKTPAGSKPADLTISANNLFVYNINGGDHTITEFKRGVLGRLENIGTVNTIPEFAAGIACL